MIGKFVDLLDTLLQAWERRILRKQKRRNPFYDPFLDYPD